VESRRECDTGDRSEHRAAVLDKLKHLEPYQIAEVMDFIDFLAERKQQQSPLV